MSNGQQAGFTLIELAMVIVMLGALSATALPKFFDKNTFAERAFFSDTLNALRYAQKYAVATHCQLEVSFSANSYSLKRPATQTQCGTATPSFTLDVIHPGTGGAYTGTENGVVYTSTPPTIIFNALGESSISVNSNDIKVASRTITVVKETGYVYAP